MVRFLFLARYPILAALALLLLPVLCLDVAPSLLGNLLVLEPPGLAIISGLALLIAWVVMMTVDLMLDYGHARFTVPRVTPPEWLWRRRLPLFGLLAVPLVASAVLQSPGSLAQRLLSIGAGLVAAWVLLVIALVAQIGLLEAEAPDTDLLVPRESVTWRLFFGEQGLLRSLRWKRVPWLAWVAGDAYRSAVGTGAEKLQRQGVLRHGYLARGGGILPGHLVAALFLAINLVLYFAGYWLLRPSPQAWFSFPSLGYVLMILLVLAWLLPGLSFFFDRLRVPVLVLLLLGSFVLHQVRDSHHVFRTWLPPAEEEPGAGARAAPHGIPMAAGAPGGQDPAGDSDPAPPVVAVAASGGGIAAAQWTARVLAGLQCHLGERFPRALSMISATSGGSVGTLFYLDRFEPGKLPDGQALGELVLAAGEPSLDAVAWGLAYPDLWRIVGAGPRKLFLDRGWAQDLAWAGHLEHPDRWLSDWRRAAGAGGGADAEPWLPRVVFNTTGMGSGRPFRIASFDVPPTWRGGSFLEAHPGRDLPLVTAARLSATFPWVTPITRACNAGRWEDSGSPAASEDDCREPLPGASYLADGGYQDNSGVGTLVEWLVNLSPGELHELRERGLLLIRIRLFGNETGPSDPGSWLTAAAGPILTLLNTRFASQAIRDDLELALVLDRLGQAGVDFEVVDLEHVAPAPLSWKLTTEEARMIRCGWWKGSNPYALRRTAAFFSGADPDDPTFQVPPCVQELDGGQDPVWGRDLPRAGVSTPSGR